MGKNKLMEAKNRKVRMYDMAHNNYVNNNIVALEYRFFEVIPYTNGDKVRSNHEYKKFMREHADVMARYRKIVGGC